MLHGGGGRPRPKAPTTGPPPTPPTLLMLPPTFLKATILNHSGEKSNKCDQCYMELFKRNHLKSRLREVSSSAINIAGSMFSALNHPNKETQIVSIVFCESQYEEVCTSHASSELMVPSKSERRYRRARSSIADAI